MTTVVRNPIYRGELSKRTIRKIKQFGEAYLYSFDGISLFFKPKGISMLTHVIQPSPSTKTAHHVELNGIFFALNFATSTLQKMQAAEDHWISQYAATSPKMLMENDSN